MTALDAELVADRDAGERLAVELRACAQEEAAVHGAAEGARRGGHARTRWRRSGRATPTTTRARSCERLAERLGLEHEPAPAPLEPAERAGLEARVERLLRRREQLGPVNPLAQEEYAEAVAHVEELEAPAR